MNIGTIYYLIPDIFKAKFSLRWFLFHVRRGEGISYINSCMTNRKNVIGGIKVFYQHVKYLRELGYDAHALALGSFDGNVYFPEIEAKNIKDVGYELKENDIVVATEFSPYDAFKFKGCRRVVFVQSWCFIKMKFRDEDKDKSYRDLGFDYVISCGDYITKSVKLLNGEDCVTIANGIDGEVFYPDDDVRIDNRVICLPRKNPEDIKTITTIVKREVPGVEFFYADGLDERGIAEAYRKSDILLASGYPEGLPLPPLEAMFSGTVVVGFSGRGGRQYMIDEKTALVSADGDCIGASENLIRVLDDKALKERLRAEGLEITKNFTLERLKTAIDNFYKRVEQDIN